LHLADGRSRDFQTVRSGQVAIRAKSNASTDSRFQHEKSCALLLAFGSDAQLLNATAHVINLPSSGRGGHF